MNFIKDSQKIKDSINEAYKTGTPFLFVINYDKSEGLFIKNPLEQTEVLFQFNGEGNKPQTNEISETNPSIKTNPIGLDKYQSKFDIVSKSLHAGTINVINLTVKTPIEINISPKEIFLRSQSPYQIYVPERFVCFSPERFVLINGNTISSNPMKGTIDASISNAEHEILNNPKEIAEHKATAQLIADEIGEVAQNVHISRFRYIDRIESRNRTLLQVSSEVIGTLNSDETTKVGNVIFNLLPAGSIAGSPRNEALSIIEAAEGESRGYYCGIAGYFNGKTLDTAVLIRFIEQQGDKFYFRSGGGVTAQSICEKEYQETLNKIYLPF